MTTTPLPPMGQDPSILRGQEIRAAFTRDAQATRQNRSLSDREAAEQIVALWTTTNEQLNGLFEDLQTRRRARLAALADVVPLGPAVPSDASPADAAVIHQAFRAALAQARGAMPAPATTPGIGPLARDNDTLDAMLADAERFNDDNLRRAVLTAAHEAGHMKLVQRWTDLMGVTAAVEEYSELQRAVAGLGPAGGWNRTIFRPLPPPAEVAQLERLKAADDAAAARRVQDAAAMQMHRTRR